MNTLRTTCALIPIALLSAACSGGHATTTEPAGSTKMGVTTLVAWTSPSLVRVGPTDSPGTSADVEIHAGRGEYESFQIIVQAPAGGLTNVNLSVSDLAGPGGAVVPKANATLFRELYVNVTSSSPNWGGSNQPLAPGMYPDGLIPFVDDSTGQSLSGSTAAFVAVPATLAAGQNQPFWVDVFVPPGTPRGQYTGTYSLTSDQGNFSGNITLKVWGFTLPTKPNMKSAFLFSSSPSQATIEELLRNKVDPTSAPAAEQSTLISQFGLDAIDLPFFSGADVGNCTMSGPPSVASLQAAAAGNQPGLYTYVYSADEIGSCSGLFPTVQAWAQVIHQAGFDNLITMAPVTALFDDGSGSGRSAVDDWVMLPVEYDNAKATIAQAVKKGDKAWSYNTLVQDAYSPKWEIDFPPLNFRIQPGFISATLSLTGILYWRIDDWAQDPWNNVNNAGTFSSSNYPGEGQLLYPGADVGTAGAQPSMRLKYIRDGVEDFDYYALLEQQGKGAWALTQIATVAPDFTNWTRDPTAFAAVRDALGDALDQTDDAGPGTPPADAGTTGPGGADAGLGSPPPPTNDAAAPGSGATPPPFNGPGTRGCACLASGARSGGGGAAGATLLFALLAYLRIGRRSRAARIEGRVPAFARKGRWRASPAVRIARGTRPA